jgi:hypothetical protein
MASAGVAGVERPRSHSPARPRRRSRQNQPFIAGPKPRSAADRADPRTQTEFLNPRGLLGVLACEARFACKSRPTEFTNPRAVVIASSTQRIQSSHAAGSNKRTPRAAEAAATVSRNDAPAGKPAGLSPTTSRSPSRQRPTSRGQSTRNSRYSVCASSSTLPKWNVALALTTRFPASTTLSDS